MKEMKGFKVMLLGKKATGQALFAKCFVDDAIRYFFLDSGSDISYLFIKPMSATFINKIEKVMWFEGEVDVYSYQFGSDVFWMPENIPSVIPKLEKKYGVKLYGIIGLDFLINNKIVLDFNNI